MVGNNHLNGWKQPFTWLPSNHLFRGLPSRVTALASAVAALAGSVG
jgi:hypothetical protein